MANRRTQIQIPDPDPGDPSATPQQLQTIRQLVAGMSLQGYRFDYRKLTATQAHAVIQQLHAMTQAPNQSNTNPPKGPGCIASIAKTTTTLIVAAVVLAGVAGGGYLIYWRINQAPNNPTPNAAASQNQNPDDPDNTESTRRESRIFQGLSVGDDPNPPSEAPANTPPPNTEPDPQSTPANNTPTPTPPATIPDRQALETLLVKLSQFTRSDFPLDIRQQSRQGMQTQLNTKLAPAMQAIQTQNPQLADRINNAIDAFGKDPLDAPALREEIKAIRQALDQLP